MGIATPDVLIPMQVRSGGGFTSTPAEGSPGDGVFPHVNALFADGFESGTLFDVSGRNWIPDRNLTGFSWGGTNYTALVTETHNIFNGAVVNLPIETNGDANSDWTPFAGTTALRHAWLAGYSTSEQRFACGQHLPDFWQAYQVRVPANYSHGVDGGNNNKWLALWTHIYDQSGDITFQLRPRDGGGGSKLVVQDGGVAQVEVDVFNDFILTPSDRGRWMRFVVRAVPASAPGANDGIIQVWRKWQGEAEHTQIYNKTNARFQQGGQGIHEGYLFGWANGAYAERTEFLVDNFEIGGGSLL